MLIPAMYLGVGGAAVLGVTTWVLFRRHGAAAPPAKPVKPPVTPPKPVIVPRPPAEPAPVAEPVKAPPPKASEPGAERPAIFKVVLNHADGTSEIVHTGTDGQAAVRAYEHQALHPGEFVEYYQHRLRRGIKFHPDDPRAG